MTPRQSEILRLLEAQGSQPPAALAEALGVSAETIRRDVQALAAGGQIARSHGFVGLAGQVGEAPFARRMRENAGAKQAIAAAAAAMIKDGEAVLLDTGTTTSFLARALIRHRRLTVVTNSSDIARTLATQNGNRVYMAGGELRSDNGAAFGASAVGFIRRFRVDHAMISAGAVDASGVMDFDLEEAEFAAACLDMADRRMVLTDASKFSRRGLITVAGFDVLTDLITNETPPEAVVQAMVKAATRLTLA